MTALDPRRAPLFEALTAHAAAGHASFHVPGHKSGQAVGTAALSLTDAAAAGAGAAGEAGKAAADGGNVNDDAGRAEAAGSGANEAVSLGNAGPADVQAGASAELAADEGTAGRAVGDDGTGTFGDADAELEREYYGRLLRLDLTELSGLDDLHQAAGVIREAEELAADCFGAARTFFLVGGSTVGNLAMVLAVCAPGDVLLVQRNVHKSVLHGLMLARARAVFLPPRLDAASGIACGVDLSDVRAALEKHPEARGLLVTNPNYYGMAADLRALAALVHAHGKPLLVDEAHGAHFGLLPELPPSALSCGADVVVQSTHKMLTAMTMGAMLHLGWGGAGREAQRRAVEEDIEGAGTAPAGGAWRSTSAEAAAVEVRADADEDPGAEVRYRKAATELVDGDAIARLLALLQSSSPSYPLLASLDLARRRAHTAAGRAQLARGLAAAQRARHWLREQPSYGSLALPAGGPGAAPAVSGASAASGVYDALDPFKVTVWDATGTLNGYALQRELERRGCFAELATPQHALLAFGPASTDADAARLCAALADIARRHRLQDRPRSGGLAAQAPLPFPAAMRLSEPVGFDLTGSPGGGRASAAGGAVPRADAPPRVRRVPLAIAAGLRAAAMVVPYPPGIPVLYPGELVAPETAAYLQQLAEQGARFHGIPDGKLTELEVTD